MSWLLSGSRRTIAPPPPQPRGGPMALAGERSEPVRLGLRDHHACSVQGTSRAQSGGRWENPDPAPKGGLPLGDLREIRPGAFDCSPPATAVQLEVAESSPGTSKFESDLPGERMRTSM